MEVAVSWKATKRDIQATRKEDGTSSRLVLCHLRKECIPTHPGKDNAYTSIPLTIDLYCIHAKDCGNEGQW
jgi:hypothetical protein